MAIDTQSATGLLEEAAAIVHAEWIRLQQDEVLWEREIADLSSEIPAPVPGPRRFGVTTTRRGWQGQPVPDERRRWQAWRWPLASKFHETVCRLGRRWCCASSLSGRGWLPAL